MLHTKNYSYNKFAITSANKFAITIMRPNKLKIKNFYFYKIKYCIKF